MESPRSERIPGFQMKVFPSGLSGSHHVEGSRTLRGLRTPRCAKLRKKRQPPPKKKQRHVKKKHAKPGNLGCFMDEFCNLFAKKINKQHPTRANIYDVFFWIRGKARWILVSLEAPIAVKGRFMLCFDAFSLAQVQRHVAVDNGNSIGRPRKGLMAYPPGNF